jgi:hypothetical protein
MSGSGNRNNPNSVRVGGAGDTKQNLNRSDVQDRMQADSRHSGGRAPAECAGSHQESRDHNKHNNPGQSGHQPQQHSPAEEKR